MMSSALLVPLIHLDFELRRDYIYSVLCINKERPITVCGGHCFLTAQLEKAAAHQQKEKDTSNRLLEISFFNQELISLSLKHPIIEKSTGYSALDQKNHPKSFIDDIFRPPQLA